jgi:hypothetical protein
MKINNKAKTTPKATPTLFDCASEDKTTDACNEEEANVRVWVCVFVCLRVCLFVCVCVWVYVMCSLFVFLYSKSINLLTTGVGLNVCWGVGTFGKGVGVGVKFGTGCGVGKTQLRVVVFERTKEELHFVNLFQREQVWATMFVYVCLGHFFFNRLSVYLVRLLYFSLIVCFLVYFIIMFIFLLRVS